MPGRKSRNAISMQHTDSVPKTGVGAASTDLPDPSGSGNEMDSRELNQSQGGNYILERWQRHGRCKHQCVGSGL